MSARGRPLSKSTTAFARYLAERGVARDEAAAALKTTSANLSSIALGKSRPSADLMYRIECWSNGAFPMRRWFAS